MSEKKPLNPRNPTQTERAYAALKDAILQGEIHEGVFLSEREIMRRYRIGRTPFREACNRLHHEGLLEVVPRRGYLVPELSFHAVRDLFELRLILEGAIAELATIRGTDSEIDELEDSTRHAALKLKKGVDSLEFVRLNSDFHLKLARMTRNRELERLLVEVLEKTQRLMYIELRWSRLPQGQGKMLHEPIVAALRRRTPGAVREALLEDIRQAQSETLGKGL
ncbi:MAG TPA: GntR family transcriptional regulator [Bryobacteraceae bacterium]|nr:GntR family transcriptional regulator [Bryobacteraceae bacterium]